MNLRSKNIIIIVKEALTMREIYKKILVAIDGSPQSDNAIHEAIAIAKRNQTALDVLYVKDETRLGGTPYAMPLYLETLEKESQQVLDAARQIIKDSVDYTLHNYTGFPKKEIVQFAEKEAVDLIVMGSNSKNLLDRILVGSTSTYVVSHAPCNVMIVK